MPNSFAFVLNHLISDITEPVEIIDGHFFKKANDEQIQKIKTIIKNYYPINRMGFPYEQSFKKDKESEKNKLLNLDRSDWRYWIVSFKGRNDVIDDLNFSASLLENEIEFGFTVIGDLPGIDNPYNEYAGHIFNFQKIASFFDSQAFYKHGPPAIKKISKEELREIGFIYELYKNRKIEDEFLDIAIRRWRDLKTLPRDSDMMLIGLFSIIECIITHKPKGDRPSIIHQLKRKIPLLSKRFKRNLEYLTFFQTSNPDVIWSNVYDYRSKLVHGTQTAEDVPQVLNSKKQILKFLLEVSKLLLLITLSEPDLVRDLKQC